MTNKTNKTWNLTDKEKKIEFFDESKEELEKRVEKIEKKLNKLLNILEKKN